MGFLFVGLGGAVGAMLRYAIGLIPYKGDFPRAYACHEPFGSVCNRVYQRRRREKRLVRKPCFVPQNGRVRRFYHFFNLFSRIVQPVSVKPRGFGDNLYGFERWAVLGGSVPRNVLREKNC